MKKYDSLETISYDHTQFTKAKTKWKRMTRGKFKHKKPLVNYIKYVIQTYKYPKEMLQKIDKWELWLDLRDKVDPDWESLGGIFEGLIPWWDQDEYKAIYTETKVDAIESSFMQDTLECKTERLCELLDKQRSKINSLERKVKNLQSTLERELSDIAEVIEDNTL